MVAVQYRIWIDMLVAASRTALTQGVVRKRSSSSARRRSGVYQAWQVVAYGA
jgi:hypothetical protein